MKLAVVFIFVASIAICSRMGLAQDVSDVEPRLYLLPGSVRSSDVRRLDLKKIRPTGEPFLGGADFARYLRDTHDVLLTEEAAERLRKLDVPASGRPFVVFAGGEAVYAGAFWKGFSSLTFRGVAVDVSDVGRDQPVIRLELDYPPLAPKNRSVDPRPDSRLLGIFERSGKLYEEVWLNAKCRGIRPTGKRRQSYVFDFEVISVAKNEYREKTISFELYVDALGAQLAEALEAGPDGTPYGLAGGRFDPERVLLIKIYRQVGRKDPVLIVKEFEIGL